MGTQPDENTEPTDEPSQASEASEDVQVLSIKGPKSALAFALSQIDDKDPINKDPIKPGEIVVMLFGERYYGGTAVIRQDDPDEVRTEFDVALALAEVARAAKEREADTSALVFHFQDTEPTAEDAVGRMSAPVGVFSTLLKRGIIDEIKVGPTTLMSVSCTEGCCTEPTPR